MAQYRCSEKTIVSVELGNCAQQKFLRYITI